MFQGFLRFVESTPGRHNFKLGFGLTLTDAHWSAEQWRDFMERQSKFLQMPWYYEYNSSAFSRNLRIRRLQVALMLYQTETGRRPPNSTTGAHFCPTCLSIPVGSDSTMKSPRRASQRQFSQPYGIAGNRGATARSRRPLVSVAGVRGAHLVSGPAGQKPEKLKAKVIPKGFNLSAQGSRSAPWEAPRPTVTPKGVASIYAIALQIM